jgi:tetratricopeptide (TPR) repeat protein
MIVRDEERFLADCLASVKDVVNEVIVVDTGSRDATKRIASEAGARVFDFTWCDDFAAARNASIRHAKGDWILVLDADEQLASLKRGALQGLLDGAEFDCGLLRLHNAPSLEMDREAVLAWGRKQVEVARVPRLLRNIDGLAFADPIHETTTPWLRRRGNRMAPVELHIVHYGATEAIVREKSKTERNVRILRSRLALDSTDVAAYAYLTLELIGRGAIAEAIETADRGWQCVSRVTANIAPAIQCLATARVRLLVAVGRLADARATLELARLREGDGTDLKFLDGIVAEAEALREESDAVARRRWLESARHSYRDCVRMVPGPLASSFVNGASTWLGFTHLGTVELLLGRPAEAREAFERALAARGTEVEARLGLAEATLDLGDAGGALACLESLLDPSGAPQRSDESSPAGPSSALDAWTLAALAAQRLGFDGDALLFRQRAFALLGRGFLAPHRRRRLGHLLTSSSSSV